LLILGISAYYHDSAACLLEDGQPIAAAQQERFSRKKHDAGFPRDAIEYCLKERAVTLAEVDHIVFYEKPLVKFERLLETYLSVAPRGLPSFVAAMPVWLREKLFLKNLLRRELVALCRDGRRASDVPLLFADHHRSHAASAFYPSPYDEAAVLCVDGVGEWATTSAWVGRGAGLEALWEIRFPHSLGLLYSAFTYYTGFKVNSGEYKVMGLAPYGNPRYTQRIYDNLIDLKPDGTFRLNLDYFDYCTGLRMTGRRFDELFEGLPRKPEAPLAQRHMDLARSIQDVTEEVMLRLSRSLLAETGCCNLCLAGGVALNCVANGRILRETGVQGLWTQPAAGDAGGALGAAYLAWHDMSRKPRVPQEHGGDSMRGSFLGPSYPIASIEQTLGHLGARYVTQSDEMLFDRVARELECGKVIGWFQGRMEFGPRALGSRSILGDARNPRMQSVMNLKIKFRESFRPFAPAVLRERVSEYFELDQDSPYMLLVAPVRNERRLAAAPESENLEGIDRLNQTRSEIPAVTHVDYSARIQTVDRRVNPRFHNLLEAFQARTGCGLLVNTSFNVRGEPIVCTPQDAYRCFMRTEMDALVLENCLLLKEDQPPLREDTDWKREFELD